MAFDKADAHFSAQSDDPSTHAARHAHLYTAEEAGVVG
jgi:hypothetical protein